MGNMQGDSIFLAWHPSALDDREQRQLARIDEDGTFAMSFPLNAGTVTELVYGPEAMTLWLEPGTDLYIKFKAGDMGHTARFKGIKAAENQYLAEHEREFIESEEWQVLPYNIMYYEEGFAKYLDRRLEQERIALTLFLTDNPETSATFREYADADLNYAWANDRITYQDLREQVVNNEGRLNVSPSYYDFLRVTHLDAVGALHSPNYQTFLTNYLNWQMKENGHARSSPTYFSECYSLAKAKFSGEVEAVMLARVLRDSFRNGYVQQSTALFDDYRQNVDVAGKYVPLLNPEFEATRHLALGAPAPAFALTTLKGDTVSIKKLQGKLVYLAFWKTTSGVSLRDLPYHQDLVRRLKGKNVTFVSIGLDDDRETWATFVRNKNLDGVHVYGGKLAQNAVTAGYGIRDVPSYMLLAEDGTFASRRLLKMNNPGAQAQILTAMGKVKLPEPPPPPALAPEPLNVAATPESMPEAKPAKPRATTSRTAYQYPTRRPAPKPNRATSPTTRPALRPRNR
ncbi:MAG: redoxin family protein [Hymenobacteraceae bacterium]|nr:redoxin family protein [Hymenobacteraceae bacterium]